MTKGFIIKVSVGKIRQSLLEKMGNESEYFLQVPLFVLCA